jgi:undecaprenyl-diphosphatase
MFDAVLDFFRSLPPAVVVGLAFLVPAVESGLVLGFVLPGELAVVTAGILAADAHVPLAAVIIAAIAGAILGDSTGYFMGRRFRAPIKKRLPTRRWKAAAEWLRRSGPIAIFLARFTAFVRSLMPPVAGAARLPYRKFLPWSVAAGILWGSGSVFVGYLFARNAEKILHWSLLIVVILIAAVAGGIYAAIHRHRHRRQHGRRPRRAPAYSG